jgi:hypothetical protein
VESGVARAEFRIRRRGRWCVGPAAYEILTSCNVCDYSLRVSCAAPQLPGDCTQDGTLDIADGVCLLGFLFLGKPSELPCDGGRITDPGNILLLDFDGQGTLDLADAVASLLYLFSDSPPHPLGTACVPIAGCEPKCGG